MFPQKHSNHTKFRSKLTSVQEESLFCNTQTNTWSLLNLHTGVTHFFRELIFLNIKIIFLIQICRDNYKYGISKSIPLKKCKHCDSVLLSKHCSVLARHSNIDCINGVGLSGLSSCLTNDRGRECSESCLQRVLNGWTGEVMWKVLIWKLWTQTSSLRTIQICKLIMRIIKHLLAYTLVVKLLEIYHENHDCSHKGQRHTV